MEWRAATIDTVSKIVEEDLKECGGDEAAAFTITSRILARTEFLPAQEQCFGLE